MQLLKLTPLLLLALAIDGFQFFVSLALSVIAALPGTTLGAAGGAAAGSYICQGWGSVIISGCAATGGLVLGVFGTWFDGAAVITEPIGIAVGFAISICISFTLGSILVLFLQLIGVLDKKAALMAYMGETLPGFSMLPAWTALVIRCGMKEVRGEIMGTVLKTAIGVGGALVLPNTGVGNAMREGTLTNRRTIVEAQPEYEFQEDEQAATPPRALPMQDMRLRRSTTPNVQTT